MIPELDAIIRRLNDTTPLTPKQSRALYRSHSGQMIKRAMASADGIGLEKWRDLSILNQPEEAFRAELQSIENDLSRQISIVDEGLDNWFETGLIVPPYYAWSIVVILAKAKRMDEEKAFLAAWCRHFGHVEGGRFEALADRARKRGIFK